jgi:hypothetical protein
LQRRLFSSLRLSVLAPLTGDAPHAKNIWAAISTDVYAKSAEPDCDKGIISTPCQQPVEKVFFLSLRAKRGNLAFNKIDGLEIASSQKLLLAMTCEGFFNTLSGADPFIHYYLHFIICA